MIMALKVVPMDLRVMCIFLHNPFEIYIDRKHLYLLVRCIVAQKRIKHASFPAVKLQPTHNTTIERSFHMVWVQISFIIMGLIKGAKAWSPSCALYGVQQTPLRTSHSRTAPTKHENASLAAGKLLRRLLAQAFSYFQLSDQ